MIARGGNNTWAPDVIRSGDKYFVYYSAPGTQPKAAIGLLVGKTLDPSSPDYKWEDGGPVVWSDGVEDSNAIDPGVFRDPTNGSLWLTYGSYFGYIRLVELNPKTGKRLYPEPEAGQHRHQRRSVDHDLPRRLVLPARHARLVLRRRELQLQHPHGPVAGKSRARSSTTWASTCCRAAASCSSARAAATSARDISACWISATACRSSPATTRPTSIAAASACSTSVRCSGAMAGPSPETTSRKAHTRSNRRAPARRSKWPCRACRSADARGRGGRGAARGGATGGRGEPGSGRGEPAAAQRRIPPQDAAQVSANWPAGPVDVRMSPYMLQAQQKWTVTPVANAGGYPGSPYFKITIAGTDRALAATADRELVVLPAFTGGPEQLWRIDQLADGTYRVMPKAFRTRRSRWRSRPSAAACRRSRRFDPDSDRQRWLFKTP